MRNIKYTKNHKKVEVIRKINSNQFLVKEIYIDKDKNIETPAGEEFIVNAILDKPLITWRERNIKIEKELYEKKEKEYKEKEKKLRKEYGSLLKMLSEKNKYLQKYISADSAEQQKAFDFVKDVLTGNFKYIVYLYEVEILKYKELIDSFGEIKLLTLLGNDNGDMQMKINQYSDGSGGGKLYYFFKTKKEAIDFIKNKIESINKVGQLSEKIIKKAKKYKAKINPELIKEWKKERTDSIKNNINSYIKRYKESMRKYKREMKEIKKL